MKNYKLKNIILIITLILAAGLILSSCSTPQTPESGSVLEPTAQASHVPAAPAASEAAAALPELAGMKQSDGAMQPWQDPPSVYQNSFNTEEYNSIDESRFVSTATKPLSTISADVDTASYANVRRMILDGEMPVPDAVRIEEMLNYFEYDFEEPKEGEPFSVTPEIVPCPWNDETKLLMIGMQAEKIDTKNAPASNFVFLIDVSGSMDDPDKLPLLQQSFLLFTEQLRPQDTVSIVTYASSDSVVISGATGEDKYDIMNAIENLTAGGSTAGSKGIETAYELAWEYFVDGGNNRVILATDGDLNVGITSEGDLKRLITQKRDSGIYLSVLGFGTDNLKDNKLEALADNGNGNYSYIDNIFEARKVLIEEMGGTMFTVAKDLKLQLEFNPARVKGYRLIGYEDRILNDEDFADDTKDAGEIGAGHRVVVLYEIVDTQSDYPIEGTDLKYQRQQTGSSRDWLTVNVRYKEPEGEKSELLTYSVDDRFYNSTPSDNIKFAAAVAEVGMLLRQSEYEGSSSYRDATEILSGIKGLENDPYKEEFRYLVSRLDRIQ
jgi:Ca-activated chloride channel family protein